jgi:hypothetical protein
LTVAIAVPVAIAVIAALAAAKVVVVVVAAVVVAAYLNILARHLDLSWVLLNVYTCPTQLILNVRQESKS